MNSKIVILAVALVAVCAQKHGHGHEQHGHGHAVSSQSHALHKVYRLHPEHRFPDHHDKVHHDNPVHHAVPIYDAASIYQAASFHDAPAHHEKYHRFAQPKYVFDYEMKEPHTSNRKSQPKARDGDIVKRYYSLHEADGSVSTIRYDSEKQIKKSFNSYVKRSEPVMLILPVRHAYY